MGLSSTSVYAVRRVLNADVSPAAVRGPQWASQLGSVPVWYMGGINFGYKDLAT